MKSAQLITKSIGTVVTAGLVGVGPPAVGKDSLLLSEYNIYAGNTHAHSIFTASHGSQLSHNQGAEKFMEEDSAGVSRAINCTLKPNWNELQGPPSMHYALAKAARYDFYAVTDHSQEVAFHPTSSDNEAWKNTREDAVQATDGSFVGLRGFEYSENNGPNGKGHINVFNSSTYLNALESGNDLQHFYKWLATVPPDGEGGVVASFNHPGQTQYNNWGFRTPEATDIITMLEVINSNKKIHYEAFISALDKGWKVSPVSGNDNHGIKMITENASRTFVLATDRSKAAILNAMKNRRTYASLEANIECRYSVNDKVMGSTLNGEQVFRFRISVNDPDIGNPEDRITKIDIVQDGGKVVAAYDVPDPAHAVQWNLEIKDNTCRYFFVRVWNAGGGDAPNADAQKSVAWLAPVWTGR